VARSRARLRRRRPSAETAAGEVSAEWAEGGAARAVGEKGGWITRAVFAANYAEQKDISEDAILGAILTGLGIDAMAAFAAANAPQKQRCAPPAE
jgi:predicted DsbA family dithiol-disulfide isomerase